MSHIVSIPKRRLFLPPIIHLQANDSDATARLVTVLDTGLAHNHALSSHRKFDGHKPTVGCDAAARITTVAKPEDKHEFKSLRELGYSFDRSADAMTRRHELSSLTGDLKEMLKLGYGLDATAWSVLGDGPRRFAWTPETLLEDGVWARRATAGRDHAKQLTAELCTAIESCWMSPTHLTPELDGGLRVRRQTHPVPSRAVPWQEQTGGSGLLVIERWSDVLYLYRPCDDWLSWFLQRMLVEAWAEVALDAGTDWHWGETRS